MKIKAFLLLAIVTVLMLTLAACGEDAPVQEEPAAAPEAPAAQAPPEAPPAAADADEDEEEEPAVEASDRGEIIMVVGSESPTMDPIVQNDTATRDIVIQLMEGLMWYAPGDVLEPKLAESYTISADAMTYTFNLRQGVYFHDGTYFTAEAVKLSLERLLDPANASPGAFILEMIDEITVVDDYTVDIVLEFPFAPFTAHLTHMVGFIMSPTALEEAAAGGRSIAENPVGTGPFILGYRDHGNYTRLVPNPNHWSGNTPAHDVIFHVVPDPSTRLAMLEAGEANVMGVAAAQLYDLDRMPHVDRVLTETVTLQYIGFQTQQEGPFSDDRVRRAVTMAVNTLDILYGVQEGQGIQAVGPIRAGVVTHAPTDVPGLPFDPDAARELLAEAGFPDGFETTFWISDGGAAGPRIAELVQANLAVIGIDVEIVVLEWGTYLEQTAEGLHDMFLLGWVTMTGDADYGIFPLWHSNEIGAANRFFYDNPVVDDLLERARVSVDSAERDALYREVTEILIYDAPAIFLFHPNSTTGVAGVDGLHINFSVAPFFYGATLR